MNKPSNLGAAGSALWDDVTNWGEDIRPDEYRILETACRTYDDMAELLDVFEEQGREWTVKGSMGQRVVNPIRSEWRFLAETFSKLMRQLSLPDTEERAAKRVDDMSERMAALARLSHGDTSKRKNKRETSAS